MSNYGPRDHKNSNRIQLFNPLKGAQGEGQGQVKGQNVFARLGTKPRFDLELR